MDFEFVLTAGLTKQVYPGERSGHTDLTKKSLDLLLCAQSNKITYIVWQMSSSLMECIVGKMCGGILR